MELMFDLLFAVLKMGASIILTLFSYFAVAIIVGVFFAVLYFCFITPLTFILGKVPSEYERIYRLRNFIKNSDEKIFHFCVALCLLIALPVLILGPDKSISAFDDRVHKGRPHEVVTGTEVRQYKLLTLSSPKHVYASFEDTSTHQVYSQMYVGTYCHGKTDRIGEKYNIKITHYYMSDDDDKNFIRFNNLSGVFCE